MSKAGFALRMLQKRIAGQATSCPYCENSATDRLGRRNLVLELRRCERCSLMFRYPTDNQQENKRFYQFAYKENVVTDLPAREDIGAHIAERFATLGRDLTEHLSAMGPLAGKRILDYGASWGYCTYQFQQAGYEVQGFEISEPRVAFGRETLEVNLTSKLEDLPDASFDAIYSAHVLEHIPDPKISFRTFARALRPGGKAYLFVPNGGGTEARAKGARWGPMINEKHVLALNAAFFATSLSDFGFRTCFTSSPYVTEARSLERGADLDGEELLVIAEKL